MNNQPFEQEQAEAELDKLAVEWALVGGFQLERVFEFKDFEQALEFVNKIGAIAQKQDHHPEIELSWGKVVVRLSTHDVGGVTEKDFVFAKAIDKL